MGHKPTLGGIKSLQKYLASTKFAMPVFRTNIYDDGTPVPFGMHSGNGKLESLERLIQKYGLRGNIVDCRIESFDKKYFLQFTDLCHLGLCTMEDLIGRGYNYEMEGTKDFEFEEFMKDEVQKIFNLTEMGKEEVSIIDEIKWLLHCYKFPELEEQLFKEDVTLVYCATPSRIASRKNEICEYIIKQGCLPFHPFYAFPYEFYEGHSEVGREKTMAVCLEAVENCGEFWLFGVSNGTLEETIRAIEHGKKIKLLMDEFDLGWKKFYEELGPQYGNPLDNLLD